MTLFPVTSTDGTQISPGGQSNPTNVYGTPRWGFEQDLTNKWFGRETAANVSTFLHELVHSINSSFGDAAAATAVYNMGLMKMSPDDYYKLPENVKKFEELRKKSLSTNIIPSNYWAGTLDYYCGKITKPSYMMK